MSHSRSSILNYGLPTVVIVVLAILLTITLSRLSDIQRTMRNDTTANLLWIISQAHVESLMLRDAVQQRIINPLSENNVAFRYQLLLSRTKLLNDGPQQRALRTIDMADSIAEQTHAVSQLRDVIAVADTDRAAYEQLRDVLQHFNAQMQQASSKAMVAEWNEAGARVDTHREAVMTVSFLMMGIWAGSAFISIQLLIALRKTRETERVKQREIQLQKQLESERKMSELYRSFGSMVSHQFRTPLAIIDASMQRLIRAGSRMDADEIARRATKARDATQRLTYLIERILQADRFMEQLKVTMTTCCLSDLLRQTIAEQQAASQGRTIHFLNQTQAGFMVECDPVLTGQILSNLLSNAIKYSKYDTSVSVRVYREGRWVCCAVRDYGRGISAKDMPHIFKRYYRAWTAADVVGTGIGLHIAAELASLQHGEIQAYSPPGGGTIFVLRLPGIGHSKVVHESVCEE